MPSISSKCMTVSESFCEEVVTQILRDPSPRSARSDSSHPFLPMPTVTVRRDWFGHKHVSLTFTGSSLLYNQADSGPCRLGRQSWTLSRNTLATTTSSLTLHGQLSWHILALPLRLQPQGKLRLRHETTTGYYDDMPALLLVSLLHVVYVFS